MAQKSKTRTPLKASFRGFEGVDLRKAHSGDESIALIENFRITEDGSLKKRCGFKTIYSSENGSSRIKALHCLKNSNGRIIFWVDGNSVFRYDLEENQQTAIGTVSEQTEKAFFFEYLDKLYLCDGHSFFIISDTAVLPADAYIPLYGKDWPSTYAGEINEPINLLSDKAAISYKFQFPAQSYLPLGDLKISSVAALYRNGVLMESSSYTHDQEFNVITVSNYNDDDEFFIICNLAFEGDIGEQRNMLYSSLSSSVFYELNNNNLFLWGSRSGNSIFYSKKINEANYAESKDFLSNNGTLYIPCGSKFSVGTPQDKINAFIRHYDRVLIMTDTSTWITDLSLLGSAEFTIKNINSEIGCASPKGALRIENTIISVGDEAIYSWTSETEELNECNAHSISDPIKAILGEDFFKTCIIAFHKANKEIWFSSTETNEIWIYNVKRKAWYKFSGFIPSAFAENAKEICFSQDGKVRAFDQSLTSDELGGSYSTIRASMKSGEIEFNSRYKKKLSSVSLRSDLSGGYLSISFLLDSTTRFSHSLHPRNSHGILNFRTKSGRFHSLSFTLSASGGGEQTIHGIEIDAD
ncbi:MAG: hypothetical protein IJD73_03260 [Clostridia bacterium]|nr:hypothetical protein [Clostridia bacterium]